MKPLIELRKINGWWDAPAVPLWVCSECHKIYMNKYIFRNKERVLEYGAR